MAVLLRQPPLIVRVFETWYTTFGNLSLLIPKQLLGKSKKSISDQLLDGCGFLALVYLIMPDGCTLLSSLGSCR